MIDNPREVTELGLCFPLRKSYNPCEGADEGSCLVYTGITQSPYGSLVLAKCRQNGKYIKSKIKILAVYAQSIKLICRIGK